MDIVAIDISGRHLANGRYIMLCAAVSMSISPDSIRRVFEVRQVPGESDRLDLGVVLDLIARCVEGLDGVVVAERGDLYSIQAWRVESILGRRFKYQETIGERLAVELAHHISVSGRRLMKIPGCQ